MNNEKLIENAYKYFDNQTVKYEKLTSNIDRWELNETDSDLQKSRIIFYDKNNKILFTANWEIMGEFFKKTNLWVWSWNINGLKKNQTLISKQLLKYGLDVDPNNSKDEFIKMILSNSRFVIRNIPSLNIISYISLYLSKKENIFNIQDDNKYTILYIYNIKIN